MPSESKENILLELFFNHSPLKEWHFEEILKETNMTRASVNKWVKKYLKTGLITRNKPKGKFPYYQCGQDNPIYFSKKRIYMLNKMDDTGLIDALLKIDKAKTIIIFGSIAKGDWYKDSDIDIFIFGAVDNFRKIYYETRMNRDIELHIFGNKREIHNTCLINAFLDGYLIKGQTSDFIDVHEDSKPRRDIQKMLNTKQAIKQIQN